MSIQLMTAIWKNSKLKGSALLLLLAIADNANTETRMAWPSIRYLAQKTRLSKRQVIRLVDIIERSGELTVLRDGYFNRYVVHINGVKMSPSRKREGAILDEDGDTQGEDGDTQGKLGDIAMSLKPITINPTIKENQLNLFNDSNNTETKTYLAIIEYLKNHIRRDIFAKYLGEANFVSLDQGILAIGVDSASKVDWLNDRTSALLNRFIKSLNSDVNKVIFVTINNEQPIRVDLPLSIEDESNVTN